MPADDGSDRRLGDALLSKSYTAQSMVRIETILKQDATIPGVTDSMTAYKMALLAGSGINELQGTDKSTYASATRTSLRSTHG